MKKIANKLNKDHHNFITILSVSKRAHKLLIAKEWTKILINEK
jgi:hypothetical protein